MLSNRIGCFAACAAFVFRSVDLLAAIKSQFVDGGSWDTSCILSASESEVARRSFFVQREDAPIKIPTTA